MCDAVETGTVEVVPAPSEEKNFDRLTKFMAKDSFEKLRADVGVVRHGEVLNAFHLEGLFIYAFIFI